MDETGFLVNLNRFEKFKQGCQVSNYYGHHRAFHQLPTLMSSLSLHNNNATVRKLCELDGLTWKYRQGFETEEAWQASVTAEMEYMSEGNMEKVSAVLLYFCCSKIRTGDVVEL